MSNLGSERRTVQDAVIRCAVEAGWTYLPPEEALRLQRGKSGVVLHEVLARQLQCLKLRVVDHLRGESQAGQERLEVEKVGRLPHEARRKVAGEHGAADPVAGRKGGGCSRLKDC